MSRNRVGIPLLAACIFFSLAGWAAAAEKPFPFQAEILESGVNIRSDATVSSRSIAKANKGDIVTALAGSYDWYKVTLPKDAPAFIKADLVLQLESSSLQVEKDRVNIRSSPDESSPIIGKAKRNEILYYRGRSSGWYRIEPTAECYGWINKKFVKKAEGVALKPEPPPLQPPPLQVVPPPRAETNAPQPPKNETVLPAPSQVSEGEEITLVGIVRFYGMVFKRPAAHKLVTKENEIFLLKGDKQALNAFVYHKAKVSGKVLSGIKAPYPVIEVTAIEALN